MQCETCAYYVYDDDEEQYVCDANMDQDEFARLTESKFRGCTYYRDGDEYKVVRHQI